MVLTNKQRSILEESNLPLFLLIEAEEMNSDDEPDASKEEQEQEQQEGEGEGEEQEQEQEQPEPSPEEVLTFELEGTEDKFLQFVLYDKLSDLSSKITILQDNIKNDGDAESLNLITKLNHYGQYLEVLNELIFSISTSTVYKILGQIELELIDILQIYDAALQKQNKE